MLKRLVGFVFAVCLSMILTQEAFSQANIGLMGIGAKLGFVDPEGAGSVIGFGALVDLGTITPDIMLEGNLDYWSDSESGGGVEVSFRDLIIGGTAKYMFKSSNPNFRPFAGGGIAFHFFKAAIDFAGTTQADSDNSETKLGIHVGGGLFYTLSPQLDLIADGRYSIVSDASQLAIQGGVVYKLTK